MEYTRWDLRGHLLSTIKCNTARPIDSTDSFLIRMVWRLKWRQPNWIEFFSFTSCSRSIWAFFLFLLHRTTTTTTGSNDANIRQRSFWLEKKEAKCIFILKTREIERELVRHSCNKVAERAWSLPCGNFLTAAAMWASRCVVGWRNVFHIFLLHVLVRSSTSINSALFSFSFRPSYKESTAKSQKANAPRTKRAEGYLATYGRQLLKRVDHLLFIFSFLPFKPYH